jgi:Mn-dependent DtxR family transcriptional regulator
MGEAAASRAIGWWLMAISSATSSQLARAWSSRQTLTERLHEHLAKRGTEPETWYALQLVAMRGPGLAREELSDALDRSPNVDVESTRELLARLEADGLIRGDEHVDLTDAGQAVHRRLREYVIGPTTELLSRFDTDDIETTVRTLQAITKKAAEDSLAPAE